ncbi:MAG: zinc metalloprotease HtpX [Candidatus Omnitrophota bacterium]|nr:zinc metalloprotease HtpX [Candidatus Omnitrophota bacterium]
MFFLKLRMFLLTLVLFGIIYSVVSMAAYAVGVSDINFYIIFSVLLLFIQYMIGPKIVEWSMGVKYIKEGEQPELRTMVANLARAAEIPVPRIGISEISLPNAFAFGRWKKDGRICVTRGILNLVDRDELRAVLGHEMSHLKNRDVLTITLLSVIPFILYRIASSILFYRRRDDRSSGAIMLVGIAALILYFISNLLVLYASRIREYFADRGSVKLGNSPHKLASALYKLVYGSARTPKEELRQVEGLKAFFVNDPSSAIKELSELRQLDLDKSGSIDSAELFALNSKQLKLNFGDRLLEILSTHPNMLKRIKQLSGYAKA